MTITHYNVKTKDLFSRHWPYRNPKQHSIPQMLTELIVSRVLKSGGHATLRNRAQALFQRLRAGVHKKESERQVCAPHPITSPKSKPTFSHGKSISHHVKDNLPSTGTSRMGTWGKCDPPAGLVQGLTLPPQALSCRAGQDALGAATCPLADL